MALFGRSLNDYIRFVRWILIAIVVAFALRLGLSLAGVPNENIEWVSLNLVLLVGLVYCAIAVQTTRFGTYRHLFLLLLLQEAVANWLIGLAIILGIVTRHNNIFTATAHCAACGADGLKWDHAIAHIVVGPLLLSVLSWLPASVILFVTRRVRP